VHTLADVATESSERQTLAWDDVWGPCPGTADVAYLDSAAIGLVSTRVRPVLRAADLPDTTVPWWGGRTLHFECTQPAE
jgi:hypothetical protein